MQWRGEDGACSKRYAMLARVVAVEMEIGGENVWVDKEANGAEVIVRKRVMVNTDGKR